MRYDADQSVDDASKQQLKNDRIAGACRRRLQSKWTVDEKMPFPTHIRFVSSSQGLKTQTTPVGAAGLLHLPRGWSRIRELAKSCVHWAPQ